MSEHHDRRENALGLLVAELEAENRSLRARVADLDDRLAGAVVAAIALAAECDRCPAAQWHEVFAYRDGDE